MVTFHGGKAAERFSSCLHGNTGVAEGDGAAGKGSDGTAAHRFPGRPARGDHRLWALPSTAASGGTAVCLNGPELWPGPMVTLEP